MGAKYLVEVEDGPVDIEDHIVQVRLVCQNDVGEDVTIKDWVQSFGDDTVKELVQGLSPRPTGYTWYLETREVYTTPIKRSNILLDDLQK